MPADPQESAAADQAVPAAAASGGGKAAARGCYRDALRHRDLRLLIAAFLVDQVGSWSYAMVISVYIFDRTHSTQGLAASAVCRWGPGLLRASYGGVIADRYQRTTVMIVSALASAVLMAGMAVVVGLDAPVPLVLAISALSSAALAPYRPAAGALTPGSSVKRTSPRRTQSFRAGEPSGGHRAGHRRPAAADRPARHRRRDQRGQLRPRGRRDHPATRPGVRFRRLARWFGKGNEKKAAIAVAHTLLCITWAVLRYDGDYIDAGADYYDRRDAAPTTAPPGREGRPLQGAPAGRYAPLWCSTGLTVSSQQRARVRDGCDPCGQHEQPGSSASPDVRSFPADVRSPAGTTTSADFCPVSPHLTARAVGAATRQHNRHPGRPPRIRTTTFPLRPPRLRDDPVGDDGLYLLEQAHPDRPASYAVRVPRCRGFASGFLPTPPHDDAVASGSESTPPLPPGDFHPQAIAHAGRTQAGVLRGAAGRH